MTTNIEVTTDSRLGECESSHHSSHRSHSRSNRKSWTRRCLRRTCCFFGLLLLINICLTSSAISKLKHIEVLLDPTSMDGPSPYGPDDEMHHGPGPNGPNGPHDEMYHDPNGPNGPDGPNSGVYYGEGTMGGEGFSQPNTDSHGQNRHKKICSDLCAEICTTTACDVFVCSETCVAVFTKRHEMRMKYGRTDEIPPSDVYPSYPTEQSINIDQSQPIAPTLSTKNTAIPNIDIVGNSNSNNNNDNNDNKPKSHRNHPKKYDSSESQDSNNFHHGGQFIKHDIDRKRKSSYPRPERLHQF